jgi:hypothetical protein
LSLEKRVAVPASAAAPIEDSADDGSGGGRSSPRSTGSPWHSLIVVYAKIGVAGPASEENL